MFIYSHIIIYFKKCCYCCVNCCSNSNNSLLDDVTPSISIDYCDIMIGARSHCSLLLSKYIQAIKISTAIVLTSIISVYSPFLDAETHQSNGEDYYVVPIWSVIVISLIRQEDVSSSFLISYQRYLISLDNNSL